jgi:hypothetical protein
MPMSHNEKIAAIKECAKLAAEYRKSLVKEGTDERGATEMANHFATMLLSSRGVLKFDDDKEGGEPWKNPS